MARLPLKRCKKCKELVTDTLNCANCAAKVLDGYTPMRQPIFGKRGINTLDRQEGNDEDR